MLRRSKSPGSDLVEAFIPSGWPAQDLVGESHYAANIRSVIGIQTQGRATTGEVRCKAVLIREPKNPYDASAIAVHVSDLLVGYLPKSVAALYAPTLDDLERRGARLQVEARVWFGAHGDSAGLGSVNI